MHLEVVKPGKDGNAEVEYVLVDSMDEKPSYDKVVSMLLKASSYLLHFRDIVNMSSAQQVNVTKDYSICKIPTKDP